MADERTIKPNWWVVSTAITERWLMLRCIDSGTCGFVRDPSLKEWQRAFNAPGRPYKWTGGDYRVITDGKSAPIDYAAGDRDDDICFDTRPIKFATACTYDQIIIGIALPARWAHGINRAADVIRNRHPKADDAEIMRMMFLRGMVGVIDGANSGIETDETLCAIAEAEL